MQALKEQFTADLAAAKTADAIEQVRIKYLGKKGSITNLAKNTDFHSLSIEEKKSFGSKLNELKNFATPTLSVAQIVAWRSANVVCGKFKSHGLEEIHAALTASLENFGFMTENKAFRPHVTLIRNYAFNMPFSEAVKSVPVMNLPFAADEICLFESTLTEKGAIYRELYSVNTKND